MRNMKNKNDIMIRGKIGGDKSVKIVRYLNSTITICIVAYQDDSPYLRVLIRRKENKVEIERMVLLKSPKRELWEYGLQLINDGDKQIKIPCDHTLRLISRHHDSYNEEEFYESI